MQGSLPKKTLDNCASNFGMHLIDDIKPEIVIALGIEVARTLASVYGKQIPPKMKEAVKKVDGYWLIENTVMFPVYHCGAWGLNRNRPLEDQKKDWLNIKNYLNSISFCPSKNIVLSCDYPS